jgi:hypothetical protein
LISESKLKRLCLIRFQTPFIRVTIASAIDDAIGIPGAVRALPVTPQRLKALLREHGITAPA